MRLNGFIAVVLVVTMTSLCTGCSWILMDRSPKDYKTYSEIECSAEKNKPVVDAVISGIFLIFGASYLFNSFDPPAGSRCNILDGEWSPYCVSSETSIVIAASFGVLALIHGISSWTGFCWANECEEAKIKRADWIKSLTPRQKAAFDKLARDLERKKHAETCRKTESTLRSFKSKTWWTRWVDECSGTWEAYAAKYKGKGYRWVKSLLIYNLDINSIDSKGQTLLHYAATIGSSQLTKYLVKKGADPGVRDNEGKTSMDIAVEKGHERVVELLKRITP